MRRASAFAPSHITGFFAPGGSENDPDRAGSLGGGFCLSLGVRSVACLEPGKKDWLWPEEPHPDNLVVNLAVMRALAHYIPDGKRLVLFQNRQIPSGYGLGSSGAGALSLALAINAVLGYPLSPAEACRVAHRAEIECGTGLGTVAAETAGGVELRVKAGAPGLGKTSRLASEPGLVLSAVLLGPLSTVDLLSKGELRAKAKEIGEYALRSVQEKPSARAVMEASSGFTRNLGLASSRVLSLGAMAEEEGVAWAMPMFGDGLFWLGGSASLRQRITVSAGPGAWSWSGTLDEQGARVEYVEKYTT